MAAIGAPPHPTEKTREEKGEEERMAVTVKGKDGEVWWSERVGSLPKTEAKGHEGH